MITQQQALEALERVYYATHASFIDRNLVRQYIEQSTAQPQAVVPAPEKYDDVCGGLARVEAAQPSAQPSQAPVVQAVQTEVRFKYESMKPIDGYDAIYAEYATTFGRYPDDFMSKVVRQTKEDLFMWWGAHREKIRAGLVLLAAQEDASSGATTQAVRMPAVTAFNVGRFCLSEDDCIAQRIDFSAYERGIAEDLLRQYIEQSAPQAVLGAELKIDPNDRRSDLGMPLSANAPLKCPITRRPFFMVIEHPELGWVPTYGGPYDSYTIPHMEGKPDEPFHERELTCHHFDHDAGYWLDDETIPMRVINEQVLNDLLSAAKGQA